MPRLRIETGGDVDLSINVVLSPIAHLRGRRLVRPDHDLGRLDLRRLYSRPVGKTGRCAVFFARGSEKTIPTDRLIIGSVNRQRRIAIGRSRGQSSDLHRVSTRQRRHHHLPQILGKLTGRRGRIDHIAHDTIAEFVGRPSDPDTRLGRTIACKRARRDDRRVSIRGRRHEETPRNPVGNIAKRILRTHFEGIPGRRVLRLQRKRVVQRQSRRKRLFAKVHHVGQRIGVTLIAQLAVAQFVRRPYHRDPRLTHCWTHRADHRGLFVGFGRKRSRLLRTNPIRIADDHLPVIVLARRKPQCIKGGRLLAGRDNHQGFIGQPQRHIINQRVQIYVRRLPGKRRRQRHILRAIYRPFDYGHRRCVVDGRPV